MSKATPAWKFIFQADNKSLPVSHTATAAYNTTTTAPAAAVGSNSETTTATEEPESEFDTNKQKVPS